MTKLTDLGVFQPSIEIIALLTLRLRGMTQAQLKSLNGLIEKQVAKDLLALLPELEQIIINISPAGAQEQTSKNAGKQHMNEHALSWWQQNNWFNAKGFERETAAARAIDVLIDLEGYDKKSEQYFEILNRRLKRAFPNEPRIKIKCNGINSKVLRLH